MKLENRFGEFIANLRNERGILQEQLCDGLCSTSMLCRFENGEREPDKLLQNRFLTRLGVVPENYENFLYYDEYERWEKRQGIVHYILEENMEEARRLLEEYYQRYSMEEPLEEQFYLAMLVQILRYEGTPDSELTEMFGRALTLTVPRVETRGFMDRVLSLEEINLLLEYLYCRRVELTHYEEILKYIEKMERIPLALAKIYPKAVWYYYSSWKQTECEEPEMVTHLLKLCDKAIELLRNANRMFYLWELFCMKEHLTVLLPEELRMEETVSRSLRECQEWKNTLEELYRDFGVTIPMYEFCYLYVESENYCIGDVVRTRRKMLGISQEKLCGEFCTPRTISTLERNMKKPQREVIQYVFDKLNLSTELFRTELVTDNPEAVAKYRELKIQNNNRNIQRTDILLTEIEELVQLEIASNRQVLMRNRALNLCNKSCITNQEFVAQIKNALECTVPYASVIEKGEKYLTNEEISCIQNIFVKASEQLKEKEECMKVLIDICEGSKYPETYLRMYEFIMAAIASYMGNKGKYDYSNEIEEKIIKLLLKNRKSGGIHEALYGTLWNEKEQCRKKGRLHHVSKYENGLKLCILLSSLCKDTYRQEAYCNKIKEIKYTISN